MPGPQAYVWYNLVGIYETLSREVGFGIFEERFVTSITGKMAGWVTDFAGDAHYAVHFLQTANHF